MNKQVYWILSGEGDVGTWERVVTTERGIKIRLTKERCGGDRWAYAYYASHLNDADQVVGVGVNNDRYAILPDEAAADIKSGSAEG